MEWYVRDIIVYGADGATRSVALEPGVNIITGDSRTGKSALVPIVDYCLGAREYEVPVGVIRDFALWYAIRLQTPHEQIFLARKEPGPRRSTNTMHLIVGREVALPALDDLTGNSDRDAVVAELSRRLGMMEQSLAESSYDTALTEPPTVRNVVPFLFQPQNVIANKDVLFYKTDQARHREHRQRLQRIFPYVLGAIDADYFVRKGELDTAQRELRRLERQLGEREALANGGISMARSLWDGAVTLGLVGSIPARPVPDANGANDGELNLVSLRTRLTALVETVGTQPTRTPTVAGDPVRAAALDERSRQIRTDLVVLRRQLEGAEALARESREYAGALGLQRGRLRAVDLLPTVADGADACPICAQQVNGSVPGVERLRRVQADVRAELEGLTAADPALAAHISRVRDQIAERRAELATVESELAELYRAQEGATSADAAWAEQQRHLGAIRFYLERVPSDMNDADDLQRRIDQLRRRMGQLQEELEDFDVSGRRDSALSVVARMMTDLGRRLNLEQPESPLRLDINRLTIVRDSPTGRPERLYEIGSGENWVGYHLCALFALHTFFLRRDSPVPSFLFLDQPSQIYFPQEIAARETTGTADASSRTDWEAVRRIYRMIFDTVLELDGRLQVVVLDHADLTDPPEFPAAIRARWRDGPALI